MAVEKIKEKLLAYRDINAQVIKRRKHWKNHLKPLLKKTLKSIINETQMTEAEVNTNSETKNIEAVYLEMKERESGIAKVEGEGIEKPQIQKGGFLFFMQMFNGKIKVVVVYPSIENITTTQTPKQLALLLPSELNEEKVYDYVTDFLEEMAIWEDNEVGAKTIGFNNN